MVAEFKYISRIKLMILFQWYEGPGAMLFLSLALVFTTSHAFPYDDVLGSLTRQVALRYFAHAKCLGIMTEDGSSIVNYVQMVDVTTFHVQLPHYVFKSKRLTAETDFEEYPWDTFFLSPMDAGCLAFVVQTRNLKLIVQTFARLARSPRSTHRANRMYLFLPSVDFPENIFEADIQDLFHMRQMDFMPDLVIAKLIKQANMTYDVFGADASFSDDNIQVELITHRFVGPDPTQRVSLDIWTPREGFLRHANLYPDKVTDLMGKEVTLTAIFYPPYSAVYPDADPPIYDGLEFRIMHEWTKAKNLTWRVLYRPNDWWGEIWRNGSGLGLSGHVSTDQADVAFGAIYLWENEHRYTDYSSVYFRASLTVVHPKPNLLPGWTVVTSPFSSNMWTALGVSVFVVTLVLRFISDSSMKLLGSGRGKAVVNMYSSWVECAFRTVGLLVLQVPPDERDFSTPRHVPMRHLVTWLILFYFVVTTGYSAGLATVLTIPRYEAPIETPRDMADRNSKWGAMDECFIFFLKESVDPTMRSLVKNFVLGTEEYFTERGKTGELGFAIEKLQNGHFALPPYVNADTMQHLRLMKDDYVTAHCVFMLRKGSPFMASINSVIRKMRDRGVILYWEDMAVRRHMSSTDQLAVMGSRYDVDSGPAQLLLRHTKGSFYVLAYGLALSLFVFVLENVTHSCLRLKAQWKGNTTDTK